MKHVNISPSNPKCLVCETFLPNLSYVMQDFYLWVTKVAPDMHICQGWRSEAEQHADFLAGKSKLDWPDSAHNHIEELRPSSEAVDLFVLDVSGEAIWPVNRYQDLYSLCVLDAQPIFWGGLWEGFKDYDHFQNESWKP